MEKLMVDSVVLWAKEYKVDGFRFDLMGHHSKANMLAVRAALDALTVAEDGVDGKRIYVYGEGWNFGEIANDVRFEQATQRNMAGTGSGRSTTGSATPCAAAGRSTRTRACRASARAAVRPERRRGERRRGQAARDLLLDMDQIRVGMAGNLKDYTFVDRTARP
jgi:hypothetical protein